MPADPTDPAIGSVLPDDHPASQVLSFQNSEWVTAIRDTETGAWTGTLTEIEAGYGYFVQTNSFDPVETLIPEADPTSRLPVVSVVSGWNMLGVVDVGQRDAGEHYRCGSLPGQHRMVGGLRLRHHHKQMAEDSRGC